MILSKTLIYVPMTGNHKLKLFIYPSLMKPNCETPGLQRSNPRSKGQGQIGGKC